MILEVKNIVKSFGKKEVLRDVSLTIEAGTLTGITGENGSGKSTLLKIIAGEWKANKGSININSDCGYCPQKIQLFPTLTVEEHFQYFGSAYGLDKRTLKSRIEPLLDHFKFDHYRSEYIYKLSGGTQQKLNLVLALLHEPKLLILDEPYNGFDWHTYLKFWEYTDFLKEKGKAVLIVSHLLLERERFDRIYNLENGVLE